MEPQPIPAAPEPAPSAPALVPAGFWIRAGAYMIDGIILGVAGLFLLPLPNVVSGAVRMLLGVAYFTYMPVAYKGQTFGKMAAGVAIARDDGGPLTYGTTFLRWVGYIVSGVILGVGFLIAAFTDKKRGLHDYIAGTRVVRVEEIGTGRKVAVVLAGLLMPMIAVLGIAAAIAIPKFAQLQHKAEEGATKGNLGALRAGASIYYGDTMGQYPPQLSALVPKYVKEIAPVKLKAHPESSEVEVYGAEVCSGAKYPADQILGEKLKDTGKWGYVADPKAPCFGTIFVDCTHPDANGKEWFRW